MSKEGFFLQKLVILDSTSQQVVDVIENVENLQIDDSNNEETNVIWETGQIIGLKAELIVVDQNELPDLTEAVREKPVKAPTDIQARNKRNQVPKEITLQGLQAQIEALHIEVQALKQRNTNTPPNA